MYSRGTPMKKFLNKIISLLLCGIMLLSTASIAVSAEDTTVADLYVTDLKVNNLALPLGIDTVPTF